MHALELCYLSVENLSLLIRNKEVSPVEVTRAHLQRIEATEPVLHSFLTLLADQALGWAKEAEAEIQGGKYRGPLHGISLGLKDLYYTKGIRTTSGVKVYDNFLPEYDSTVTARFKKAGTILLGKLNLHPLAMGGKGENPFYGNAHNPWNPSMVCGGSSSGSGSAAASGQCTITMGSDTGGSIRIPASFCGLVGHKPTYGVVSRYGVSPLAWSLDHCGPMTRTVMDSALAMNAIAGHDPKDPASSSVPPPDYTASIKEGIKGLRIGVPKEYFEVLLDPEIKDTVLKALDLLQELGAEVREISWPNFQRGVAMAHLISIAEASNIHSGLARTHDSPEVSEVLREFPRIEAGMTISAADYLKIQQLRARYTAESHKLMEDVDLLAGPTMPMTTFPLGSPKIQLAGETVVPDTAIPTYTRPFDFNGFPAVTVPCGFSVGGLPIGLQLAGRPHEDATVLRAAYAYEQATNWHTRKPSL